MTVKGGAPKFKKPKTEFRFRSYDESESIKLFLYNEELLYRKITLI